MTLAREAKRKLMSNDVDVGWGDCNNATVFAGMHTVGRIEMVEVADAPAA